jgi:hypothetical protein
LFIELAQGSAAIVTALSAVLARVFALVHPNFKLFWSDLPLHSFVLFKCLAGIIVE